MKKSSLIISIILLLIACNNNGFNSRKENLIRTKIIIDSLNKCDFVKREALDQIKRGNLILYRDFDNYIHAKDYFLNKFDLVLLPETKYIICAQQIMDSVIFKKYGKDILILAKKEIPEIYSKFSANQVSSEAYLYAERQPEYPGGIDSLYCDIYRKIPKIENCTLNLDFTPIFEISFIVDTDGTIKVPRIIYKLCPNMDSKIIKVIGALNKRWKPAFIENKPVPFEMTLSLDWKLQVVRNCGCK